MTGQDAKVDPSDLDVDPLDMADMAMDKKMMSQIQSAIEAVAIGSKILKRNDPAFKSRRSKETDYQTMKKLNDNMLTLLNEHRKFFYSLFSSFSNWLNASLFFYRLQWFN